MAWHWLAKEGWSLKRQGLLGIAATLILGLGATASRPAYAIGDRERNALGAAAAGAAIAEASGGNAGKGAVAGIAAYVVYDSVRERGDDRHRYSSRHVQPVHYDRGHYAPPQRQYDRPARTYYSERTYRTYTYAEPRSARVSPRHANPCYQPQYRSRYHEAPRPRPRRQVVIIIRPGY